jgi:RNA polymerase sigma-70 factor, ECF subfamily
MLLLSGRPLSSARIREESLVKRLRVHDPIAVQELMEVYSPRLQRIAAGMLANSDDAEDVVQQSLWKAYSRVYQYRSQAAFYTWLVSITMKESITFLRKRKVVPISLDNARTNVERELSRLSQEQPNPEDIAIVRDLEDHLLDCLTHIPPNMRTILLLRLVEDQSNDEIASHLHISVNAVKIRYHRGVKQLRQMMSRRLAGGGSISKQRRSSAQR